MSALRPCPLFLGPALAVAVVFLTPSAAVLAAPQVPEDAPIDLSLESAELLEVLGSFARIAGVRLETDVKPGRKVTLELKSTPWVEVLQTICAEHLVECRIEGDPPALRVTDGQAVNLSLKSANLEQVLSSFARIAGVPLEAQIPAGRLVTTEVRGVGWRSALDTICTEHGLECTVGGEPAALRVLPLARNASAMPAPARGRPLVLEATLEQRDRQTRGLAHFDWTTSTFTLGAERLDRRLDLVWLPLEPGAEVLLPLVTDCASGQVRTAGTLRLQTLEQAGWSWRWDGWEDDPTSLSLQRPEPDARLPAAGSPRDICALDRGVDVDVRFGPDLQHQVRLPGERGHSVILAGRRGSASVALVHLGFHASGGAKVAVVSPAYGPTPLAVFGLGEQPDDGPSLVLKNLGLTLRLAKGEAGEKS